STPTHTKKASRSATPKWRPSTSKATPSILNGITPSSHDVAKPQVEAFILRRRLSLAGPFTDSGGPGTTLHFNPAGDVGTVVLVTPPPIFTPGSQVSIDNGTLQ